MRRLALVWAIAFAALLAVGAAAPFVPRGWLPDPSLVVATAVGLHVGGARGLLLAWGIGWTADLLSQAPLGQHALHGLGAWCAARLAQRRVDLGRPVVLAPFVLAVSAAAAAAGWATGSALATPRALAIAVPFALANTVLALALRPLLAALLGDLESEEPARGTLRLDAGPGVR